MKIEGRLHLRRSISRSTRARVGALAVVALNTAACGGGPEPLKPEGVAAVAIIAPDTIGVGQNTQASVRATGKSGATVAHGPVTWTSSALAVLTVDASGRIVGLSDGISQVAALVDGHSALKIIAVTSPSIAIIAIAPQQTTIIAGTSHQFSAVLKDASGAVLANRAIEWQSSDLTKATVSPAGVVTGISPTQSVDISASAGGRTATTTLAVMSGPTQSLSISPPRATLGVRETLQLSVSVRDQTGGVVFDKPITWQSSNVSLATVSNSGLVSAHAPGSAVRITASSEGKTAEAEINIAPTIVSMSTGPVSEGDTLVVRGYGLANALFSINGASTTILSSSDTTLRVVVPSTLPKCSSPMPVLSLSIAVGSTSRDTSIRTFGSALNGPSTIGQHLIASEVGSGGCRMSLKQGRYGVALYTMNDTAPSNNDGRDTILRNQTLRIVTSNSPALTRTNSRIVRANVMPASLRGLAGAADVLRPRTTFGANPAVCVPPRRQLGDTLTILYPGQFPNEPLGLQELYKVYAVSPHYVFLARPVLFDTIRASRKLRLDTLVQLAETYVYPFITATLGAQPDVDGDGKLNVILENDNPHYGPEQYALDGCHFGDFVDLGWNGFGGTGFAFEELVLDGQQFTNLRALAHESAHWYDSRFYPWYALEGFAMIVESMWASERMGKPFWTAKWGEPTKTDLPLNTGPGPLATHCLPFDGHLMMGFGDTGGYRTGCTFLMYLIEQRRREGADPTTMLRMISKRPYTLNEVGKLWIYLGGSVRSSNTLMGEMMLSLYADGVIPGISEKLQWSSFDLAYIHNRYSDLIQFPGTVVDISRSIDLAVPLRLPDGVVLELVVPPGGATVSLPMQRNNVGFGIVLR